jgi:hypothetical protein
MGLDLLLTLPEHGPLPLTLTAATGEGIHFYFGWPEDIEVRNTASRLGAGIDTRGEGGYVVLPPSTHPSGATYRWANELEPAHAPQWLLALLAPKVVERGAASPMTVAGDLDEIEEEEILQAIQNKRIRRSAAKFLAGIAELAPGGRNNGLHRLAAGLREWAQDEDQWANLRELMIAYAPTAPDFPESEVEKVLDSVEAGVALGKFPESGAQQASDQDGSISSIAVAESVPSKPASDQHGSISSIDSITQDMEPEALRAAIEGAGRAFLRHSGSTPSTTP